MAETLGGNCSPDPRSRSSNHRSCLAVGSHCRLPPFVALFRALLMFFANYLQRRAELKKSMSFQLEDARLPTDCRTNEGRLANREVEVGGRAPPGGELWPSYNKS